MYHFISSLNMAYVLFSGLQREKLVEKAKLDVERAELYTKDKEEERNKSFVCSDYEPTTGTSKCSTIRL